MAEPAFYTCRGCGRDWKRVELKLGPNPPRVCPHCTAGPESQVIDQAREDAYMGSVYKPMAQSLARVLTEKTPADHWHGNYLCYVCRKAGQREHAVVRAFSGEIHSGEGWPACAQHAPHAIERALAALHSVRGASNAARWSVIVYTVEDDGHGFPKLGHKLYTARLRTTVLQGVPAHATQDPKLPPGPKV